MGNSFAFSPKRCCLVCTVIEHFFHRKCNDTQNWLEIKMNILHELHFFFLFWVVAVQ